MASLGGVRYQCYQRQSVSLRTREGARFSMAPWIVTASSRNHSAARQVAISRLSGRGVARLRPARMFWAG